MLLLPNRDQLIHPFTDKEKLCTLSIENENMRIYMKIIFLGKYFALIFLILYHTRIHISSYIFSEICQDYLKQIHTECVIYQSN